MCGIGTYLSSASVFWMTAALGIPALLALWRISPSSAVYAQPTARGPDWRGLRVLFTDRRLLAFGMCALLFHLSNAAMLPLAAAAVTKQAGDLANLIIAACIMVPQAVVAIASPWIGAHANRWGRRPILLIGWGVLPVRAVLLALLPGPWELVTWQSISGISAAVFGVMLPLIAADLTRDKGHFNLCMGAFGLCVAGGATLSTAMAGWVADSAGQTWAFLALGAAGAAGTLLVALVMPETAPKTRTAAVGTAMGGFGAGTG